MKQKFQTTQHYIHSLEQKLNEARNDNKWELESDLYHALDEFKEAQKLDIRQNWLHVIEYWFSTNSPNARLEMLTSHNIVKLDIITLERFRFVHQRHSVRAPITKAKEIRFWTYWRDNAECAYCHKTLSKSNGQIDHVIPVSAWPAEFMFLAEDISNLVASCKTCNVKKNNFLQLPDKTVQHVEIDTCLPKQNSYSERCPNEKEQDCETCGMSSIEVLCNVHGKVQMQLCKLTAMNKYLGHN